LAYLIQERYKNCFEDYLPLHIPEDRKTEVSQSLNYRIDYLLSTNFKLDGKLEHDIDELLGFCKKSFIEAV
jgi:hypothetical protein